MKKISNCKLLSLQSRFAVMIRQRTFYVPARSRRKDMVINMFDRSNYNPTDTWFFEEAYINFALCFGWTGENYVLHRTSGVEAFFQLLEEEAQRIMKYPECAKFVRDIYYGSEMTALLKEAAKWGVELKIPSFI